MTFVQLNELGFDRTQVGCRERKGDLQLLLDQVLAEPAVQALRNPYDPASASVRRSAEAPPLGGISVNWGPAASGGFTVLIHGSYKSGGAAREIRKTIDVD